MPSLALRVENKMLPLPLYQSVHQESTLVWPGQSYKKKTNN